MKAAWILVGILVALSPVEAARLKPGGSYTFAFKRHPQSLWSLGQPIEKKKQTAATVWLPEDYTRDREFPLVVYMGGGRGESGHGARAVRHLVGKNGVICVSLPLFKIPEHIRQHKAGGRIHPLYIDQAQVAVLWPAHRDMLEKIFEEIPNIDRGLCFMGGFSNGAHATAVQLNDREAGPGLRSYFTHFYFVEGGSALKSSVALADTSLLFMQGEHRAAWLQKTAAPLGWNTRIKVEVRTMPGVGHAFPEREKRWLGNWIRETCGLDPLPAP